MAHDHGFTFKQIEKKNNKYVYEVIISKELTNEHSEKVFERLAKDITIPGFRPGKAPKEAIEKRIAMDVLTTTINELIPDVSAHILEDENLNPIANLIYDLKEAKEGEEGITYSFTLITNPEIDVEKLKKIKVAKETTEVKDDEVDAVIKNMIRNAVPKEELFPVTKTEDKVEDKTEKTEDSEKETKEADFEITDELVKRIGYEEETTYSGLKAKVKDTLISIKKEQTEEAFLSKVLDEAVKVLELEIPQDFIDKEVGRKEEMFNSRLKQVKLDRDDYLATQGKNIEQQMKEWTDDAKLEIASDLITINLAVQEKLVPTAEELEQEIEAIKDEKLKAQYKSPKNKDYLRTMITRSRGAKRLLELVG